MEKEEITINDRTKNGQIGRREKLNAYHREYYKKNREKIYVSQKKYEARIRLEKIARGEIKPRENLSPEERKQREIQKRKEYYTNNPERLTTMREKSKSYSKERYDSDPEFRRSKAVYLKEWRRRRSEEKRKTKLEMKMKEEMNTNRSKFLNLVRSCTPHIKHQDCANLELREALFAFESETATNDQILLIDSYNLFDMNISRFVLKYSKYTKVCNCLNYLMKYRDIKNIEEVSLELFGSVRGTGAKTILDFAEILKLGQYKGELWKE